MLRVSLLLGAVLYVTLLIAGQDRGQMRPGLARAMAENQEIREITINLAGEPYEPPAQIELADAGEPPPVARVRSLQPEPAVERQPVAQEKPVFTLASLPSLGGDRVARPEALPEALPEIATPEENSGQALRYISGNGVNVRMGPSRDTSVITKLARGEAVTLISDADPDWAEILIEGDGLQGYVAKSLLRSAP